MPAKTLAASLADLDDVAPQDEDMIAAGPSKPSRSRKSGASDDEGGNDDDEGDDDDETASIDRSHYTDVGKSDRRRKANLSEDATGTLRSGRYAGKTATLADMQESEDGDDDDDEDEDEELDSGREDEDLDEEDGDEEEELMGSDAESVGSSAPSIEPVKTKGKTTQAKKSKSVRFAREDEDDADAIATASSSHPTLSSSLASQSRLLSTLRDEAKSDAERGEVVEADLALWHRTLENRIRLERVVGGSKGLGKIEPRAYRRLLEEAEEQEAESSKTAQAHRELLASLQDHADLLLEAQAELVASCVGREGEQEDEEQRAILQEVAATGEKRKARDEAGEEEEDEDELRARHSRHTSLLLRFTRDALQPFATSVLDKHSAQASSSALGADSNKFSASSAPLKAFNQSIPRQVDSAMAGEAGKRLVERTKKFRGAAGGVEGAQGAKRIGAELLDDDGNEEEDEQNGAAAQDKDMDVETFDDSDFYAWLLRSLIESQQTTGAATNGSALPSTSDGASATPLFHPRTNTKTKGIDTRASKGRKLRFEVIEKVANFMPRIETQDGEKGARWTRDMVDRLFASLPFAATVQKGGKKAKKARLPVEEEKEEAESDDEEDGEKPIAGGELGDLRLFG
ncbi:hypothetical protein BDZ90DRAFT_233726 [Jaminaea rosea]|uniref:Protein BFR2 n=1 Tax=Jaminaea rosea TaxID=1569628 RepID=A0A316UKC2_9BASI|nr:hypothetical protein BDZ90DRAFT_233726 [Jaminaea rosea]PWN25716.1 hypothetical protein BDZ90DRAFT_233726 [Jaminaea rosea]